METQKKPIQFRSKALFESLEPFAVIIVTGGSSGIGCSFIKAIRTLRPEVRLCNLSRSIPEDFSGGRDHHIGVDLSDGVALASAAEALCGVVESAPEGGILLINNSGFGDYGLFQQRDGEKQTNMIDLNIRAVVDLTARLMPRLLERGGAIMNIASTAAFQPTPFLATYGASKAFVLNWTLALNEDLRGTKVRAIAVCPGPTRSNFFKRAGFEVPPMQSGGLNSALDMTADEVVALALHALARRRSLVVTGWINKGIAFFGSKFPKVLVTRIGGAILRKLRLGGAKA